VSRPFTQLKRSAGKKKRIKKNDTLRLIAFEAERKQKSGPAGSALEGNRLGESPQLDPPVPEEKKGKRLRSVTYERRVNPDEKRGDLKQGLAGLRKKKKKKRVGKT